MAAKNTKASALERIRCFTFAPFATSRDQSHIKVTAQGEAVAAGGSTYDKAEDFGFIYMHSFVDPDGHGWGLLHMSAPPPKR